jgi:hypothetical protein
MLLSFIAVPVLPDGTVAQGDRQHTAFSYSGILASGGAALAFVLDLMGRLRVYLDDYYTVSGGDLTTYATRYMNALPSGDRSQRWHKLVTDATEATL